MAANMLMLGNSANVTETSYDDVILASTATKYYTGMRTGHAPPYHN